MPIDSNLSGEKRRIGRESLPERNFVILSASEESHRFALCHGGIPQLSF